MYGMPEYLFVEPNQLGKGSGVRVRVAGTTMEEIGRDMAQIMVDEIRCAQKQGKAATFIVPVGPVDQFPILAGMINAQRLDCRDVCLINMDEYLTDGDEWIDIDH